MNGCERTQFTETFTMCILSAWDEALAREKPTIPAASNYHCFCTGNDHLQEPALIKGRKTMNGCEKGQIHGNFYNMKIKRVGESARSGEANRTSSIEL